MHRPRSTFTFVAATAILAVSVLTPPAALAQDAPVTLRLAVADDAGRPSYAYVNAFVEAAASLSDGAVTIEPLFDAGADTERGFEQGTAQRLVDGDVELALAASRAWEHVGIPTMQVLQAPFLIDSDALAIAVAESPLGTRLLEGMSAGGVTGLALWPEDLRHPVAIDGCTSPLVTPESFAGLTIRAIDSKVTFDLLETLGATPTSDEYDDACGIDGAESGLRQGQSLPFVGTFTGDVTFFPKYQVLAANSAAFERLSEAQRTIIGDAAAAAQQLAIDEHPGDAEAAAAWCAHGGSVVLAGPDGVAAFVAAAQPIYDALAADPATADAIEAIQTLKGSVAPNAGPQACAPAIAVDPPQPVAAEGATPIDGVYVTSITYEELVNSELLMDPGEINDQNWGDIAISFHSGEFSIELRNMRDAYISSGTYEVDGDQLVINDPNACCPVEPHVYSWSLDGDTLTLARDRGVIAPTTYIIKPWTRVE